MSDAGGEKIGPAGLIAIDQHKETLFAILRDAYERGPKSEPFDENKTRFTLVGVAQAYFDVERMNRKAMLAADRRARLRELEKALRRARTLTDKAIQNDVGTDLRQAWWENKCESTGRPDLDRTGQEFLETDKEFEMIVATLSHFRKRCFARRRSCTDGARKAYYSTAGLYLGIGTYVSRCHRLETRRRRWAIRQICDGISDCARPLRHIWNTRASLMRSKMRGHSLRCRQAYGWLSPFDKEGRENPSPFSVIISLT